MLSLASSTRFLHASRPREAALRRTRSTRAQQGGLARCSSDEPLSHIQGAAAELSRRSALGGAALLLSWPGDAIAAPNRLGDLAEATSPLWERLQARQLNKPVFNVPPREQEFPAWLEGTWDATSTFEGYAFPSKSIDKRQIVADTTVPGFLKLSMIYLPDVGAGGNYQLRYRRRGGPGSPVTEDRATNIASIVEGSLKRPGELIDSVDYSPDREPNRCTVVFRQNSNNNAERVELFSNARESVRITAFSALRETDGVFYSLESIRQVTLGYSTKFGASRTMIGDYLHVWSFRRLEDGVIRARLSTAAYVQPNDALRYTGSSGGGPGAGGAPIPNLGNLLSISTEPVVLYSHTIMLRRPAATANGAEAAAAAAAVI